MIVVTLLLALVTCSAFADVALDAEVQPLSMEDKMRRTVPMMTVVEQQELLFAPSSEHYQAALNVVQAKKKRAVRDVPDAAAADDADKRNPVLVPQQCPYETTQIQGTSIVYSQNTYANISQPFVSNLTCAGDISGGRFAWFEWVSRDEYGTAEVSTCGLTSFDTVLLVLWSPVDTQYYPADSDQNHGCINLQCAQTQFNTLSFNDDWHQGGENGFDHCSRTTFAYAPNQYYYILVGGYRPDKDYGTIGLSFRSINEQDTALLYEWREDLSCAAKREFQVPDSTTNALNDANPGSPHNSQCINWFHERDITLWDGLGLGYHGLQLINLNARRLRGPISARLNTLSHLVWIDLAHNSFGPHVPYWAMHLHNAAFKSPWAASLSQYSPLPHPVDNFYCAMNDNAFDCCNVPDDIKYLVKRMHNDKNLADLVRIIGQSQCFIDPEIYLSCEFPLDDTEAESLADIANRYGTELNDRGFHGWDQVSVKGVKAHYCSWNGLDVLPSQFSGNGLINFNINSPGKRGVDPVEHKKRAQEKLSTLSETEQMELLEIISGHDAAAVMLKERFAAEEKMRHVTGYNNHAHFHKTCGRSNDERHCEGNHQEPDFVIYPKYYFPYYIPTSFNSTEMVVVTVDWRGAQLPSQPLVFPTRGLSYIEYCDVLGNDFDCPSQPRYWEYGCFDNNYSADFYYGYLPPPCPQGFDQPQVGYFSVEL